MTHAAPARSATVSRCAHALGAPGHLPAPSTGPGSPPTLRAPTGRPLDAAAASAETLRPWSGWRVTGDDVTGAITRPVVVPGDDARRRTGARFSAAPARVLVRIRADMTNRGRVSRTKDISSARSHAGAVFGVLPAPAEIVAGGRSADVRSVLRNGAVIDSSRRSHHPLPWRNTPSGGENHVSDAAGRPVYDGVVAAAMFRLYTDAVQAESELTARRVADHPRRRGRRSLWAWPAGLASRVGGLLHCR